MTLIDKAKLLNTIATQVHYDSEHSLEMYAKMLSLINDAPDGVVIILNDNRCVMCGEIIPEGRQVCYICERKANERQTDPDEKVSSKVQGHGMESTERMEGDPRVQ